MRIWAGLMLAAAAGCGIDDFETTVEDEATIQGSWSPGGLNALDFGAGFDDLDLTTNKTFADQGVSPGDVDGIFIKGVQVLLVDPMELKLGPIVESIELFVSGPAPLEKKRLASIEMVPTTADDLTLTHDGTLNLKDYATASQMTLTADVKLKQRPLASMKIRTVIQLAIDANIAGI